MTLIGPADYRDRLPPSLKSRPVIALFPIGFFAV
jgi:hypothetical protein